MKEKEWIVSLRALACMAIVLLHVVSGWISSSEGDIFLRKWSPRYIVDEIVIQLLVRWAVPCFIMISGNLLLDPDKNIDKEKFRRYLITFFCIIVLWGTFFSFIENIVALKKVSVRLIISSFMGVFSQETWSHMWYMYMILGLYMLLPLLRPFCRTIQKEVAIYIGWLLVVFTIIIPNINIFIKSNITTLYIQIGPWITYFLLGYILCKYRVSRRYSILCVIVGAVGYLVFLALTDENYITIVKPENICIFLFSVGVYSLAIESKILIKISSISIIKKIAKYSLGIYIIHPLFLNIVNKGLHIYPDRFYPVVGECLFFFGILGMSYYVIKVFSTIQDRRNIKRKV